MTVLSGAGPSRRLRKSQYPAEIRLALSERENERLRGLITDIKVDERRKRQQHVAEIRLDAEDQLRALQREISRLERDVRRMKIDGQRAHEKVLVALDYAATRLRSLGDHDAAGRVILAADHGREHLVA